MITSVFVSPSPAPTCCVKPSIITEHEYSPESLRLIGLKSRTDSKGSEGVMVPDMLNRDSVKLLDPSNAHSKIALISVSTVASTVAAQVNLIEVPSWIV